MYHQVKSERGLRLQEGGGGEEGNFISLGGAGLLVSKTNRELSFRQVTGSPRVLRACFARVHHP